MNLQTFWKADWFVGLAASLIFALLWLINAEFLQNTERSIYDLGLSSKITTANERIALIGIDDQSINKIGPWPWSRAVLTNMVASLEQAQPSLIVLDINAFFNKPYIDPSQSTLSQLAASVLQQDPAAQQALLDAAKSLDVDGQLAIAMQQRRNVLLPIYFEQGSSLASRPEALPPFMKSMQVDGSVFGNGDALLGGSIISYPFDRIAGNAVALGHTNIVTDSDGVLRSDPLLFNYFGKSFPSLALAAAAAQQKVAPSQIQVSTDQIVVGKLNLPVQPGATLLPAFHSDFQGKPLYPYYSFADIYNGRIPVSTFANKIVLVGLIASQDSAGKFQTPIRDEKMSAVEFHAHTLDSILSGNLFSHPGWALWVELFLLVLVGAYLSLLLPKLEMIPGLVASVALIVLLPLAGFLLLNFGQIWIKTATPAVLLFVGHIALAIRNFFSGEGGGIGRVAREEAENNKMLAMSFQQQGMLDMAFEKFRKCPVNEEIKSLLFNLAAEYERKRKFANALSVYEYIAEYDPEYKDLEDRMERVRNVGETMVFGGAGSDSGMSSLLAGGNTKPTLGRYEIIRELGKGAMGVVYLGTDPKINRQVAIKTMALAQEFEPNELEEVKRRFFREAETAGRLNHPNIVTMFDAGEEHDLAYIAMEYLDGVDLMAYTKPGKLMPRAAALKIVGKVAEALNYAHARGVVHRDIKPANIMLLKNKIVKVTDFGIARITVSSKTKTGVVLGTPSYMSPEQLSGKHVDGRSDLFSLGVMLYELLTGTRPFKGDSMATLMFQIANEPHPDVREHQPDLPESVSKLIDKALAKEAEARYANGAEMVQDIIKCLRDLTAGRSK